MELIGADQVLGLLADLPLDGGQQLRRDRGIQNVLQYVVEGLVLLGVVPGKIPHQVPHQGLGDGAVDGVHAHVVAVVGAPAQGQLTEVASADDDAAVLIGDVHQHLGPLPGLAILKGDGVILHVVTDVLKVAADGGGDIYGFQGSAQLFRQDHSVVFRPVGGAEAGHGNGHNVRHGPVQHLHGKAGDEHRQGGVQAAGEAHHRGFCPGVLHPLLQSQGCDQQNLPAAGVPVLLTLWNKGHGGHIAGQLGGGQGEGEQSLCRHLAFRHRRHGLGPAALISQPLDVDFRDQQAILKPLFTQKRAILRNQLVGAEYHVRGGLPLAAAGIDVAALELGRLHGHQLPAVGILSDDLVAGREIADDGGACLGHFQGGGTRCPQVLADLKTQHQVRNVFAAEYLHGGKRQVLPTQADADPFLRCRSKLAFFVKFTIIGQVALGNQT